MPPLLEDELHSLREAVQNHDFLHRIVREIERLHRIVFHAQRLDWQYVRAAAEEILIADIVTRYGGNIDGVYFALRKTEDGGMDWQRAIANYAAYAHNYYTTPLGVVMRKSLFGEASHFVTPAAGADSALAGDSAAKQTAS
jgi:hypothetical protein